MRERARSSQYTPFVMVGALVVVSLFVYSFVISSTAHGTSTVTAKEPTASLRFREDPDLAEKKVAVSNDNNNNNNHNNSEYS